MQFSGFDNMRKGASERGVHAGETARASEVARASETSRASESARASEVARESVRTHANWLMLAGAAFIACALAGAMGLSSFDSARVQTAWADEETDSMASQVDVDDTGVSGDATTSGSATDADAASSTSATTAESSADASSATGEGDAAAASEGASSSDETADDDATEGDTSGYEGDLSEIDKGPAPVSEGNAWEGALENIRTEIDAKLAEAAKIAAEIEEANERASELRTQIDNYDKRLDELLDNIEEHQKRKSELQKSASELTKTMYKSRSDFDVLSLLDDAESITDIVNRVEMRNRMLDEYNNVLEEVKAATAELEEQYAQASKEKDAQLVLQKELQEKQADLDAKRKKLDKAVKELRKREDSLDVEQKILLSEAAAAAGEVAETFKTGELGEIEGAEWRTGLASAYGGSTDDATPKDTPTATGTMCDDWSMGVAVPMAWGPSKYYGHRVEISYEGRSVVATVVDCGGMNDGERALDLQPGVFKAFGSDTCEDWGVRTVRYRFL